VSVGITDRFRLWTLNRFGASETDGRRSPRRTDAGEVGRHDVELTLLVTGSDCSTPSFVSVEFMF
jgi:hypothetical protein